MVVPALPQVLPPALPQALPARWPLGGGSKDESKILSAISPQRCDKKNGQPATSEAQASRGPGFCWRPKASTKKYRRAHFPKLDLCEGRWSNMTEGLLNIEVPIWEMSLVGPLKQFHFRK